MNCCQDSRRLIVVTGRLTFPLSDIAAGSYYIEIDITDQNKNIIATYTTATPITISARNQPLPVITFTANGSTDRLQVSEGANIKLAWNTTKAVSCSNNWAGWPDVSGSTNIIASTATSYFRIVCANANGATESKTIYVTVVPLARTTTTASETPVSSANTTTQTQTTVSEPSVTLTANGTDRLEINAGWNIKLVWNAQNAVSCVNSWDASTAVSGVSAVTANTSTSLYRITCKNASGITQTKTAYVTVLTQAQGTAEASPVSRATDKTLDSSVFASVLSGFMSVIDYLVR